jgi:hypothetical protein
MSKKNITNTSAAAYPLVIACGAVLLSIALPLTFLAFDWFPNDRFWLHWEVTSLMIMAAYMAYSVVYWFWLPPKLANLLPSQATHLIRTSSSIGASLLVLGALAAILEWGPRCHTGILLIAIALMLIGKRWLSRIQIETSDTRITITAIRYTRSHNSCEHASEAEKARTLVRTEWHVWWYGDLPTAIGFLGVTVYIWVLCWRGNTAGGVLSNIEAFIGGAIAFQLLLSNAVYAAVLGTKED